jgi:peptidoglycan hydrolase-like protein with peptidoglycan-binding domain
MKNFISFCLVFVMLFGFSAQTSHAMTFDELAAQVVSLKKEIAELKASLTGNVLGAMTTTLDVPSVLKQGAKGVEVKNLQLALKNAGYFTGKVDGSFGPLTVTAIKKYQAAKGITVTGMLDEATKTLLFNKVTESMSGGEHKGDSEGSKKLIFTCLTRVSNVINPNPATRSLKFILGTDSTTGFMFVKPGEKPALYPYNSLSSSSGPYPNAPYSTGSGSNRVVFQATLLESDYPAGSFNLSNNINTGINTALGQLYGLSTDGTTYYPLTTANSNSWSLTALPPCGNEKPVTAPVLETPPTCPLCGTLGQNTNGGSNTSFAHWPRANNPVEVGVNFAADNKYQSAYTKAVADWSLSPVLSIHPLVVLPGAGTPQVQVVSGYYNQAFLATVALSTTSVLHSDGTYRSHILPGVVVTLNDKYLGTGGQYDSDAWRQYSLCDALGHVFGLNHQNETFSAPNLGSCMDYTMDPTGQNTGTLNNLHPNQNDLDALVAAYHVNPGDADTTGNKSDNTQTQSVSYTIPLPQ